jgi:hypothetical protein
MKTSNKIITAAAICLFLGIVTYTFMMRGAYQEALKNPFANELRIDLKTMKHLEISYNNDITIKYGNKNEIVIAKNEKDSLKFNYQGDRTNLTIGDIGSITIYLQDLPTMSFSKKPNWRNQDFGGIIVDESFKSGEFIVSSIKQSNIQFQKCNFDKIDIQSNDKCAVTINAGEIKSLNINLPKKSYLWIEYANILSKNVVLGDSCEVKITGNQTNFLK